MTHAWTKTINLDGETHFAHHWQGAATGLVIDVVQDMRVEWVVRGPLESGFLEGRGYRSLKDAKSGAEAAVSQAPTDPGSTRFAFVATRMHPTA